MNTITQPNVVPSQEDVHQESLAQASAAKGVIPYLEREIVELEEEIRAFRAGEREDSQFLPFRLRQGVYGQRQSDSQMVRVKIPGGVLTPGALRALGVIADKYSPLGRGHVTTRENIQYHHLKLEDCPEVLRLLGEEGLTTREACGNTVRNVVGSPTAGVCPDEIFDVTPYLAAYVRFAVRHPLTQNFPRKFKTSFSGCVEHDSVASAIHDLSYIAQIRHMDGVEVRGFRVVVGGATSIMPRLGKPLFDFVPEADYLRVAEALWRVFDGATMLRKNRMMARIKVLIDRIGFEPFKELVEEELKGIGPIDPVPLMDLSEEFVETPPALPVGSSNGHQPPEEFLVWKASATFPQKQDGYHVANIRVPQGNITGHQFSKLADLVSGYTGGAARATQDQNLTLRWVPEAYLIKVWEGLKEIGLAEPGAGSIVDVTSCPGTDSCKLGITSSMGLGRAIMDELDSWDGLLDDPGVNKLRIKMSGCPNGCGLHHIANIGFHGAAMKGPDGVQIPAYEIFLGGSYGIGRPEDARFGERLPRIKVPAKRVPQLVHSLAVYYKENRQEAEEFNDFLDRVGPEPITAVVQEHCAVAPLGAGSLDLYMDWDHTSVYKLERGEGECSA